ncbi:hypothetical protein Tco_0835585 [Tanacetum coccineum]
MMEVILDEEEVAVDAIPLATKPPSIVDLKIIKEGEIGYYQIIRADGNSKRYSSMIQMLKRFNREDLKTLWKLVKAKNGYTRPKEGYERVPWGDLKTMFEHNIEDTMWRNLLGNKVLIWKLFDSYGVHFVRNLSDHHPILMLELRIDYSPTPFSYFHSWFNLDGFDKIEEDTWKCLATVDSNELNDINSIDSLEVDQNSKVRWAIEGDENKMFFHGILNSKLSQLAICKTLVDGE